MLAFFAALRALFARSASRVLVAIPLLLASTAWAQQTLVVALYPWVPDTERFKSAIGAAWQKVQPGVKLEFISDFNVWDGGYDMSKPPDRVDVFVFDAMYFEDYRARQVIVAMTPAEVQNADDFLDYARNAVTVGGSYYAIPQLGCANILFYKKWDVALANATTLGQVQQALNPCTYTSEIPPDQRGLMLDMKGGTTNAALYLDIAHSRSGVYPLPQPAQPDPAVIAFQRTMLTLGSYLNATSDNPGYPRGDWFDRNYGRAFMGFTESMSVMSPSTLSNIAFKVMPLSDTAGKQALFYVDAIGVNSQTLTRGTRNLAVQLANVMAAKDTIVASFAAQGAGNPQYLMSVRNSAFQALSVQYPIYKQMYQLAQSSNPVAFKLDANARAWVKPFGAMVRQQVTANYACGCDRPATRPIQDNRDAPNVCPATCAAYGGWNGQWTNQRPAAQQSSVCGCNTCPIASK
jgi:thiamine pyridinylase